MQADTPASRRPSTWATAAYVAIVALTAVGTAASTLVRTDIAAPHRSAPLRIDAVVRAISEPQAGRSGAAAADRPAEHIATSPADAAQMGASIGAYDR